VGVGGRDDMVGYQAWRRLGRLHQARILRIHGSCHSALTISHRAFISYAAACISLLAYLSLSPVCFFVALTLSPGLLSTTRKAGTGGKGEMEGERRGRKEERR